MVARTSCRRQILKPNSNRNGIVTNIYIVEKPEAIRDMTIPDFKAIDRNDQTQDEVPFNVIGHWELFTGKDHPTLYVLEIKGDYRHANSLSFLDSFNPIQFIQSLLIPLMKIINADYRRAKHPGYPVFSGDVGTPCCRSPKSERRRSK